MNQSTAPKINTAQNKSTAITSNSGTLYTSIRKAILNEISGAKASAQQSNVLTSGKEVSHELYSSRKSPHLRDIIESRQKDVGTASIYEAHRGAKEADNSKLGISIAGSTSLGVLGNKVADTLAHESNPSGTLSNIQKKIKVMLSGHSSLLPKERPGSNQSLLLPAREAPALTVNLHETILANKRKAVEETHSNKLIPKKSASHAKANDSSAVVTAMSLKLLSRGRQSETKVGDQSSKFLPTKAIDTSNKDYARKFFGEQQSQMGMTSKTVDAKSYIEKALGKSTFQESISKRVAGSSFLGPNNVSVVPEGQNSEQQLQIKSNPLYQRFSQKLAAKPTFEAAKEQNDGMQKWENLNARHQKNQSFHASAKSGMTGAQFAKPGLQEHKEQRRPSSESTPDDVKRLQTTKQALSVQTPPTGVHKRAESENLKKLFSSAAGERPDQQPVHQPAAPAPSRPDEQEVRPQPKSRPASKSINLGSTLASLKAAAKKGPADPSHKHTPNRSAGAAAKVTRVTPSLDAIRRMESALPQFESAKVIVKDFGKVKAFAVNTHQGIVRSYNEDRVSILLNAQQR